MNKFKSTLLIIILSLLLIKCSSDGSDLEKYYERNFKDIIVITMNIDTVKILIEQLEVSNQVQENIPYDTINNILLVDTLKIELDVKFGSYLPDPDPYKNIVISNDTLYIWYASRKKPESTKLLKSNSANNISGIDTSPKLEYYNIENVIIKKSPHKRIKFESKLYQ